MESYLWDDNEAWDDAEPWFEGTPVDFSNASVSFDVDLALIGPMGNIDGWAGHVSDEIAVAGNLVNTLPLPGAVSADIHLSSALVNLLPLPGSVSAEVTLSGGTLLNVLPLAGSILDDLEVYPDALANNLATSVQQFELDFGLTGRLALLTSISASIEMPVEVTGYLLNLLSTSGGVQADVTVASAGPVVIPTVPEWTWNAHLRAYMYDAGPYLGSRWLAAPDVTLAWHSYNAYQQGHGYPGQIRYIIAPSLTAITSFPNIYNITLPISYKQTLFEPPTIYTSDAKIPDDVDLSTQRLFVVLFMSTQDVYEYNNQTGAYTFQYGYIAPQPPFSPLETYPSFLAEGGLAPGVQREPGPIVGNWTYHANGYWYYETPYLGTDWPPQVPPDLVVPTGFNRVYYSYFQVAYDTYYDTFYNDEYSWAEYYIASNGTIYRDFDEDYRERPAGVVTMGVYLYPTVQTTWSLGAPVSPQALYPSSYGTGGLLAEPPPGPRRPVNDLWANRIPLDLSGTGDLTVDARLSTFEDAWDWSESSAFYGNLWYSFTSPVTRTIEIWADLPERDGSHPPVFVYTEADPPAIETLVGSGTWDASGDVDADGYDLHSYKFLALAGKTYSIEVTDGARYTGVQQVYNLHWQTARAPAYDTPTGAIDRARYVSWQDYFVLPGAGYSPGEPNVQVDGRGSVWLRWQSFADQPIRFDVDGQAYAYSVADSVDILIIAYAGGPAFADMVEVARADTTTISGDDFALNFNALDEQIYYIQVQTMGGSTSQGFDYISLSLMSLLEGVAPDSNNPVVLDSVRFPTGEFSNINRGVGSPTYGQTSEYFRWTAPLDYGQNTDPSIRDMSTITFPDFPNGYQWEVYIIDPATGYASTRVDQYVNGVHIFPVIPGASYLILAYGYGVQGGDLRIVISQAPLYRIGPWISRENIQKETFHDMPAVFNMEGRWRMAQNFGNPWPSTQFVDRQHAWLHATQGDWASRHFDDSGEQIPYQDPKPFRMVGGHAAGDSITGDRGYFMIPAFLEVTVLQQVYQVDWGTTALKAPPAPPAPAGSLLEYEVVEWREGELNAYDWSPENPNGLLLKFEVNFHLTAASGDLGPYEVHLGTNPPPPPGGYFGPSDGRFISKTINNVPNDWNPYTSVLSISSTAVGQSVVPNTEAQVAQGGVWQDFFVPADEQILEAGRYTYLRSYSDRVMDLSANFSPRGDQDNSYGEADLYNLYIVQQSQVIRRPLVTPPRYRYLTPYTPDVDEEVCPPRAAIPQAGVGDVDLWASYQGAFSQQEIR